MQGCLLLEDMKVQYKEIFMRKRPDVWNEITLNTGGISSTLQDIKAHQRSGGYVYSKIPNRFIYWRTDHSKLEVVEESLDINLHGNQLRYKFTDSPVLEGISVTETFANIIILVPTVSSLHRFTFPHPDNLLKKGYKEQATYSIFHNVNETDSSDPSTYFILNSPSSNIVSGVSCIATNGDSIFALSLANTSILLIRIDSVTGQGITSTLTYESMVPRFLSGLTDAIRGKEWSDCVSVSLILSYLQGDLYLFGLDREGTLKVWSCERNCYITSHQLLNKNEARIIKGHKHKMCKGELDGKLVLYCCLQGSCIAALLVQINDGIINFQLISQTPTPSGLKLVEMCVGEEGDLWCSWLTGDESPTVTKVNLIYPNWAAVLLAHPPLQVKAPKLVVQDPATLYLDAIFTSGFFTATEVATALSIFKTNAVIKTNVDIKEQICAIVEAEIYSESGGQDFDDDEYLEMTQRCWSRLYSCCSQFVISGMLPLGMVWLGSSLVLIQECGFSMVMEMNPLQLLYLNKIPSRQLTNVVYARIVESVRDIDLDCGLERLELGLLLGESFSTVLKEAADMIKLRNQTCDGANRFYSVLTDGLDEGFNALLCELSEPQVHSFDGTDTRMFCSNSGLFAVTSTFRDFCSVRLRLCERLLLLLQSFNEIECNDLKLKLSQLCEAYYVLYWTCITNVNVDEPIIFSYILINQGTLMQDTLPASVLAVASALWIRDGNVNLANHLYSTKEWVLLQTLSRITNYDTWRLLLAESYLYTGEGGKAFDVAVGNQNQDMSHHMKVISLFERHSRPDLAIAVAKRAMAFPGNLSQSDKETLQSVLFLHQVQLKHYDSAYFWLEECKNWSRKIDSLHRLVTAMLADGKLTELISFRFIGLTSELDKFLSSRARSRPFKQAVNYYNLLYAFHVKHDNYKRASTIMFEKALRSDTAEMQWRCFAACLNALTLVPQEDAWLLRPKFNEQAPQSKNLDSVEILVVDDIRKEYELSGARYNLGDCCAVDAGPDEVIALCISKRQFKMAMRLANLCGLSCAPVIYNFTAACFEDNLEWSKLNAFDDMLLNEEDSEKICWRLLERLISKYEKDKETVLHKAASLKMLEMGVFLPAWLIASYKKRNAAELLKLYLSHGYLEEASDLACDYIRAALGIGSDAFSIEMPLLPNSPPLYLPINTIELLILELSHHNMETELLKTLQNYQKKVEQITEDKRSIISSHN
ncbi:hypothetical protein O3M35_001960 [Rhynocoris fuscipes]|uniref:Uncharacterized protein n=1 Tax=Rhynocoris fuscipes TaxID=488301 RepID=A0AAW1CQG6_9HEMI